MIQYLGFTNRVVLVLSVVLLAMGGCDNPTDSGNDEDQDDGNTEEQTLFAGGSGTSDDPYQIETLAQLDSVRHFKDNHFIQIADIDAGEAEFQPIGSEPETYFAGSYDGNGYTILNLTITQEEDSGVGLFGFVADTVEGADTIFENITLENVSITGRLNVGGVFGVYNRYGASGDQGNVVIRNARVTGTVKGEDYVGCLAGQAIKIEDSSADCSVTGTRYVGGLVGSAFGKLAEDNETVVTEAKIVNSHATGKVKAVVGATTVPERIGGLAGVFKWGLIENSYATGNIDSPTSTSNNSYNIDDGSNSIGGLVGNFTGQLRDSYATGNVTGEFKVGGLVGSAGNSNHTFDITTSHATGNITGYGYIGGFAGSARGEGQIIGSEAKGSVKVNDAGSITGFDGGIAGGFIGSVGKGGLTVTNCFAEGDLEGTGSIIGGFVGRNSGIIKKSYATGDINGYSGGGFVGGNKGKIIKSFTTGNVEMDGSAGGFAGGIEGEVTYSYAHGSVSGKYKVGGFSASISDGVNTNPSVVNVYSSGSVSISNPDNIAGGLFGSVADADEPKVEQSFWDTEKSGQSNGIGNGSVSGNVSGLETSEMTGTSAEDIMTGFDFNQIWKTTDSYPVLQWQE